MNLENIYLYSEPIPVAVWFFHSRSSKSIKNKLFWGKDEKRHSEALTSLHFSCHGYSTKGGQPEGPSREFKRGTALGAIKSTYSTFFLT